jgi:porin
LIKEAQQIFHPIVGRRYQLLLAVFLCLVPVDSWADSSNLIPDAFGVRHDLSQKGVDLTAQSTSDILGSTTGGAVRGGTYSGLLVLGANIDLEKSVGWEGASFNSTWIWLYGNNLSTQDIGNSMYVSGIAGQPAFSCYQLWLEQKLFQDTLSLRGGLLGLDTEFGISKTASLFVNTTFGMPYLFLNNLPNGGPTYPMATPGIRLAFHPASWMTFRSALTQANPFTTQTNPNNFNWNFGPSGGLLSLNEVETQWNSAADSKRLSGTAKAGFWIQTGETPAPQVPGVPGTFVYGAPSGNAYGSGFYAILDQQITDPCHASVEEKADQSRPCVKGCANRDDSLCKEGLRSFARIGFSPEQWSVTSFYADGGLVYKGLLPGRKKDNLGLAFAYAQMSPGRLSQASAAGLPGGSFESVAELSYSWIVSPAFALQPDLQYVIHPNGTEQYGNALVVGIRAAVNF